MPDLAALQQRLRDFKTASDNLELQPLLTKKDLERFWVEYQVDLIDELEQAVEDCTPQNNKIVFTGHRGCGKSTLLAEFRDQMTQTGKYFVVQFSIADAIEDGESTTDLRSLISGLCLNPVKQESPWI